MIICLNNLYIPKHTHRKKNEKKNEIIHHCDKVLFFLMSIYIYGFQSFGDDGLRELDEIVEDDDDNEENALVEFVIDG